MVRRTPRRSTCCSRDVYKRQHQDAVAALQGFGRIAVVQLLGIHPADLHPGAVFVAAVAQGLGHREVGVVELHIFPHQGDGDLPPGVGDAPAELLPVGEVRGCLLYTSPRLEAEGGLALSGQSPDGRLVEAVERRDHPFFVGVQYHPELSLIHI